MHTTRSFHPGLTAALLLALACGVATAAPARFAERDVSFQNGAVELRGTLIVPAAAGRHPAVVFLHGSGPVTREGARPYAEEFAAIGVAGLVFDKRGSGASGGSWTTSSLDDLAGDGLAAIAYLKTQPEIDPARIGFWGVSQAAWVATRATARSGGDVAFMVLISGGGASPRESELFSYEQEFEKAGLTAAELSDARGLVDAYLAFLATGEGRPALVARLAGLREGRLSPLAEQIDGILPSDENRTNWSWVAAWDPAEDTATITCPVLLMFGDRDTSHPTDVSVRKWKDGLKQAGNDAVTLVVFPGAGHGIRMRDGFTGKGRPPFADGYADLMLGWLWRNVVTEKQ